MNQSKSSAFDIPTILIVDDTPSNLSVVVNLFEDRGYRVAIAQDGEEGLQRAQLVQPDLIMLDVMMPGIDGFETCRRLKALENTRDIPVIFMTALASSEHKVKGFESGGVDYVTKPLQINEVMARVDTHLKLSAAQKRLEQQNAQLERHSEELEQRVVARTAELAASEREFRTLAENQPDNLARYDKQCRIIYMNPRLEKMLGQDAGTMIGKTPLEACPGPLYVDYQAMLAETNTTGAPREMEITFPDQGGGVRYHHIRFVAERDAEGEITGVLTIGRDITERKEAERELLLLNLAVNASTEAVFLMNEQGRFVYVNDEACRSLGYSREELLGMTPLDIDPDITGEVFAGLLDSLFAHGPSKGPMESRHRTRDGRVFPVEIVGSPITLESQSYSLAMVRDISERKHAERLLHEKGQAIRAVVDNSPDAIARYDRQLRRIYVNPATQALYGLPFEEIVGKTFDELPPLPTPPDDFASALKSVFERGQECQIELPFRKPNGETGWGDMRMVPEFDSDGVVVSVLSIGRDISERKRAEEALVARERDLREERGLFVGGPSVVFKWKAQDGWPVEYVSPNVREQFGYSPEVLTGDAARFRSIVHPDDIARVSEEVASYTAAGRSSYEQVYRIAHASGDYRWIYDFTVVSRGADGEVEHYHGYVMDITDQKLAENELKEREQRYHEIFENVTDSLYLVEVTPEGRFRHLAFNAAFEKSTGIPREALIGRDAGGVKEGGPEDGGVTEETARSVLAKYRHCIEVGEPIEEDSVLDLPSGVRHYHSTLVPLRDESGRIYRILGVAHDVTEIKRVEREFRTLAENIPDHIIRYDNNARKIYVNMATARLMGVKPEAILNQTPEETPANIRAMEMDEFARRVRQVLETGEPQEFEATLRHAEDGMQVHNVRFVAERDEQGKIVGALMVGRDITAMKVIENELTEREQRYREIFDNAVEGMYLLEVTEDGRFRNIDINPALASSTGIPREAMIGRFVDETLSDEVARTTLEKYRRCVAAGTTITESIELDLPAGKRYYYSTVTPIYYGDRIHRLIGISRDITELKRAERELEESRAQLRGLTAKREEAREEERKYIAREVHDELGQILTGLQLNVSVLTHKFAGESPALREQLQETRMLTDRALGVARNVASALRPAALDMGIVSALEWLVGRFGANTGIHCEVHAEDADIHLDESHAIALFRIVQESLTNVARHAKANSVDIDLGMIGNDYSLKVRDNGAGFDQAAAKADSFGLVGMRERALLLGGEILINSKPGEGTEIEVRIPAHNVSGLS